MQQGPIGVFDSGYGGLTILKEIKKRLPSYNYIYLGDNARAPYGNRSFETIYRYTWQCVQWFFKQGCPLVILACNTASAKALRTIQQQKLASFPGKKVLGIIRPTTEVIGNYSTSKHIGILATNGTVQSDSYRIEIEKFFPGLAITQLACPMLVPLVENNEINNNGADFFVRKYADELLAKDDKIDTVLLACTHYPLLKDTFKKIFPESVNMVFQGEIIADSLQDYLNRHPETESLLLKENQTTFYTTDDTNDFDEKAKLFYGEEIISRHLNLEE